jgi:hypothetical protein
MLEEQEKNIDGVVIATPAKKDVATCEKPR